MLERERPTLLTREIPVGVKQCLEFFGVESQKTEDVLVPHLGLIQFIVAKVKDPACFPAHGAVLSLPTGDGRRSWQL